MRSVLLATAVAVAIPFCAPSAQAAETLEVVSGPLGTRSQSLPGNPIGQSFTSTIDVLTSVGFQFNALNPSNANAPITLSIFSGETLTGTALFTTSFTLPTSINSLTPAWFDIAIPDLALTQNQKYSLVLSGTSYRNGVLLGPDYIYSPPGLVGGDAYTGGKLLSNNASIYANCKGVANNCDLNFRVTGFDNVVAPVPEPGSWAMMIGGFGLIGGALRRRRSTALRFAAA